MKMTSRITFYILICFLALGISKAAYAGPVYPVLEDENEKKLSNAELKEELRQLQLEVQNNIDKTNQLRGEEKQQQAILKDIKNKIERIQKRLPS